MVRKDVEEYEEVSDVKHVLLKPDMYLGDADRKTRKVIMYDDGKMVSAKIDIPEGLEKCIVEVLENAVDNKAPSLADGYDPKYVRVNMSGDEISVKNYGRPISLKKRRDGLYNPEFIFGRLRCGSNLNKDKARIGKGTNGLGAKLTLIYSRVFRVEVADSNEGKYFSKIWRSNMSISEDSIIEPYDGKDSYVKITWIFDKKAFGYPKNYVFDDTFIKYIRTRCIHLSFTDRLPFIFNGEYIEHDMESYSKLYMSKGTKRLYITENSDTDIPKYEVCIFYTPDKGRIISFCNGIYTTQGGIHVDTCFNAFKQLTNQINKENPDTTKMNIRHIKTHISLIVSVRVKDQRCSGQMKEKMTGPKVDIKISKDVINKVKSWGIMDKLKGVIDDAISQKIIKTTDGKKIKNIGIFKGSKANKAGGKKSHLCVLYAVEGDTAEGYAKNVRSFSENGTDYIGTFPLRGKILNPRNHSLKNISECEEINQLKKVLGLKHGKDYSKDISSLRYGKIRILTDADDDGYHIACLLINVFDYLFPGITKSGFMELFETPVVRATKGKVVLPFYTVNDYEKWKRETNIKGWTIRFFKGLGSSTAKDTKEDIKNNRIIKFVHDSKTAETLDIAFNNTRADERKDKILKLRIKDKEFKQNVKISEYLDTRLVMYWRSNIVRSIPQLVDGFKESVRKIFWALWQIFHLSNVNVPNTPHKLSQVVFEACKISDYHKGDSSVDKLIKKLCADYVGTNNIPMFEGVGNFGDRSIGLKGAGSSRYLFIKAYKWIKYVFRIEDLDILQYNVGDKGESVEPKFYLPIIPMALVNGCKGIGSGWSTEVSKYNMLDIIDYMRATIRGEPTKKLKPYFVNFKGKVESIKGGFRTIGEYKVKGSDVYITELPIGKWYKNYEDDFIITELEKKDLIRGYDDNCKKDPKTFLEEINFKIKFKANSSARNCTHESLRLITNFSYGNMYLLNEDNIPVKYNTVDDIVKAFYDIRLGYYDIRKQRQIKLIKEKMEKLLHKIKLITLISIDKKIDIRDRLKAELYEEIKEYDIPTYIYDELKATCLSKDDINRYNKELNKLQQQLDYVTNTDIKDMWLNELDELEEYIVANHNYF